MAETNMASSPTEAARWPRPVLLVCVGWLLLVGVLWVATGRDVPVIHVRWAPSVTADERTQMETKFGFLVDRHLDGRTWRYIALTTDEPTLKAIVIDPRVDDTAFVGRGDFKLDHPPTVRLWAGRQFPALEPVMHFRLY